MKLRRIWLEGTFTVLEWEHNLKTIKKRDVHGTSEECLLSTASLNLKKMIRVVQRVYSSSFGLG